MVCGRFSNLGGMRNIGIALLTP
ncbi:hypothetical protein BZG74_11510 [Salinivibrio sharmensis]|uniref:Uncharacterized protein n=1 Tax=Salinivibrio sharmensis TaxID=390883 RepID=A0ABX3KDX3_9GAMM|nr:hypothetical protein BZG74_11510 [Salinivibrio sharmensis]